MDVTTDDPHGFVSTGHLPDEDRIAALLTSAVTRFAHVADGDVSDVYPALQRVSPDLFGVALHAADGRVWAAGDVDARFPIMSVSKPFVFALICDVLGVDPVIARVGADPTGRSFNSLAAVEESGGGRTNPMVNSGAIATTSLAMDIARGDAWQFLSSGLSRFAGRILELDEEVLDSARRTNHRNRAIGELLLSTGAIDVHPVAAVDLYTAQCCLAVTARDVAVMGATLADGGINPATGERVVSARAASAALASMAIAGMYETSGTWLLHVGLPGKSGIGGGIVSAAPGKGGLGTYSPRLDTAGNSVRGQLATRFLAHELGLDLFASEPSR